MENITSLFISLTAMVTAFVTFFVTLIKSKEKIEDALPKKIKNQVSVDTEIISHMERVKEFVVADRVQIYDFHNGGHYANGRSALKTSCSYEVVRSGVKAHQKELQAVPLSCIPQFIRALLEQGELKVDNLESIKSSMPATYELKKSQEVRSFYDIILNNKSGEPIGFLAIQYNRTGGVDFTEEEKNEILRLKFFIEDRLEKMVSKNM